MLGIFCMDNHLYFIAHICTIHTLTLDMYIPVTLSTHTHAHTPHTHAVSFVTMAMRMQLVQWVRS